MSSVEGGEVVEFVGIDWATRRAAWCAVDGAGRRLGEGALVTGGMVQAGQLDELVPDAVAHFLRGSRAAAVSRR